MKTGLGDDREEPPRGYAGYVTKLLIFGLDVFLTLAAFYFSLLLAGNFELSKAAVFFSWATPLLLLLRVLCFFLFRTFTLIIRYIGEKDYKHIFYAATLSSLAFASIARLSPGIMPMDNAIPVILTEYFLFLLLAGGARIGMRLLYDQLRIRRKSHLNTAIFGAGELGAMLERVLRHNHAHNYRVVTFFDDNPKVHKKFLNGVRIFNPRKTFAEVIRQYDIKVAIIGINKLSEERRIEFIDACLEQHVKVLKVPPVESWISDSLQLGQLEHINFEDLLNRPAIQLDEEMIDRSVHDKVILVTGCAGSIGGEIVRQLLRYAPRMIVGVDQAETPLAELALSLEEHVAAGVLHPVVGDVKDAGKMRRLFEQFQPAYVFHAAAYKHVPVMERFPEEAVGVNIGGTKIVADLAGEFGAQKFVMISTDKVVNPGNVMGASKRIAEIYVQSLNRMPDHHTCFITTRFGNVLGSNGSVIPIFRKQIQRRQPVTVTHPEVTRFFMTIPEACQLVLEAGAIGEGGEIFIFDMGEPVRIVDLARKMIQMAGLTPGRDLEIVFTGLRPGEKITEELLDAQEGQLKTHHPKIRKAAVRDYDFLTVKNLIEELVELAAEGAPAEAIVRQMKKIVPEFTSRNSSFSQLDRPENQAVPSSPKRN